MMSDKKKDDKMLYGIKGIEKDDNMLDMKIKKL